MPKSRVDVDNWKKDRNHVNNALSIAFKVNVHHQGCRVTSELPFIIKDKKKFLGHEQIKQKYDCHIHSEMRILTLQNKTEESLEQTTKKI